MHARSQTSFTRAPRISAASWPATHRRFSKLGLESLEQRQMLAGEPVISEFLARNDGGLRDGTGRSSDWIEILNVGDEVVNLKGYHLTDSAQELNKWTFPDFMVDPGELLVVFASGQTSADFIDQEGNLHTNFTLRRGGEYLALVSPDNQIVSEFGSAEENYPEQLTNVSYGAAQSVTLINPESPSMWIVPLSNFATDWRVPEFDAAGNGFVEGTAALGYEGDPENRTNYTGQFTTELPAGAHAVYARMEFRLGDPTAVNNLSMKMKYDNGFAAYLNGTLVASANAPETLSVFSTAPDRGPRDSLALDWVSFDLSPFTDALLPGGNVLAIHGLDNSSDGSDKLFVVELTAGAGDLEAAIGDQPKVGYMPDPSPLAPNSSNDRVFSGFVTDTRFSVDRGFYTEPFPVEITTDDADAQIRYTLDGSAPTETNGEIYTGPITISTTSNLRAAAFKPDHLPSNVDTQTYIFPPAVFQQSADFDSTRWGHAGPDWEMDPEVIHSTDPESRPEVADLLTLPTLSLTMNWDEMFGAQGIYINGQGVERATSIEYLLPDGTEGFQIDGSVQIVGGTSPQRWKSDKLSMRLKFNREFGSGGDLEYPVFGPDNAQTFDTLTVDAHLNNVWHYGGGSSPQFQRTIAQYLRDVYASDLQLALEGYGTHDQFVYVYINGVFWGMHRLHERPDDNFAASYLGGDNSDYDIIKHTPATVVSGSKDNYERLLDAVREDMTVEQNYRAVEGLLDIDDFINYMLVNIYGANGDWAHHNWYASYNRVDPEGRWRFHSWDAEKMIQGLNDDVSRKNDRGGPTEIHQRLTDNPEYALRFADHVQEHMFGDGVLTPAGAAAVYQVRLAEIDRAVRVESARWGDNQRDQPFTRGVEWVAERDRLLNEYFPQRTEIVLEQLSRAGLYPDVAAPKLNQVGGVVPDGFQVTMGAADGTVYYTTDGSDPRATDGQVANQASAFANGLAVGQNGLTLRARTLKDGVWSALVKADFELQSDLPLRITEINYMPLPASDNETAATPDRFEFVELTNVGTHAIDLGGVQFVEQRLLGRNHGITFDFAAQSLAPGEQIVVVRDVEAFRSRYGDGARIAVGSSGQAGAVSGQFGGDLAGSGEQLVLVDAIGNTVQRFSYFTGVPWPTRAAGQGSTLQVVNPHGNYSDAANWKSSGQYGGSPGSADTSFEGQIVVNEVLANAVPGQADMIELRNTSNDNIDISGWYVSDTSSDLFKTRIAAGTSVPAGGFIVLNASDMGLSLDGARGGEVALVAADEAGQPLSFVDQARFGASLAGVSVGPTSSGQPFSQLAAVTLGAENAGARVGDVIITEVNYVPADADGDGGVRPRDFQYLEIYNRTDNPVDISNWELAGDVEYTFREAIVDAHETLLVTRFNPDRGTSGTVFRFAYGLPLDTVLVGGHRDTLSDAAQIQLLRPGSPDVDPDFVPLVPVDQVVYESGAPWPSIVPEGGDALHRTRPEDPGSSASSWVGSPVSPGTVAFVTRNVGDSNQDGEFNQLDITTVLQGGKYGTGQPATFAEGDWNGDGLFNQLDIVAALQTGTYLQGPLAARAPQSMLVEVADELAKREGDQQGEIEAMDVAWSHFARILTV